MDEVRLPTIDEKELQKALQREFESWIQEGNRSQNFFTKNFQMLK